MTNFSRQKENLLHEKMVSLPFFLGFYHFVTALRNRMYDWEFFLLKFKTPMIGVGNLSVGGSGKSPMVMYLADYLAKILEQAFYLVVTEEKPKVMVL